MSKMNLTKNIKIKCIVSGIKMGFQQKLGKVCDMIATGKRMYSVMGSWKLGKTRKILIPEYFYRVYCAVFVLLCYLAFCCTYLC